MPGGGIPWMTAVTAEAARKEMRRLQAMDKDAWDGRRNIAFNAPERRGAKPVAPALPNRPYPVFFIEPPCNPIGFRHDWFLPKPHGAYRTLCVASFALALHQSSQLSLRRPTSHRSSPSRKIELARRNKRIWHRQRPRFDPFGQRTAMLTCQ